MSFLHDLRVAARSLARSPGLAIIVILTLALGIGANAAIFTLVRGVQLKPLVNRDEDRLIYLHQSAPGIGADNANFSVRVERSARGHEDRSASSATSPPSDSAWSGWASRARSAQAWSAERISIRWGSIRCWAVCWTRGMTGRRPPALWC